MEELEGIDEITRTSRQADVFDYSQDSYMGREDEEEMEKSRKRDVQLRMADQAKKDKAKAQKAADLSNQQKADVDEYIDRMTRRLSGGKMSSTLSNALRTIFKKSEFRPPVGGTLNDAEFAAISKAVVKGGALAGLVADHQNNKGSDAVDVFQSLDSRLKRVSPEGKYSQIAGTKEYKAAMKAFEAPTGQKPSKGFMGKLKGAFGFEENLKLSKTDLQKIIREELDALEEYNTGMGGGYDQAQNSYDRFAGQRRRKADEEEKLKIIRKAEKGRQDKAELASMAQAKADRASDMDDAIESRDRVIAMQKKRLGFNNPLPGIIGQIHMAGELEEPEMIQSQSFLDNLERALKSAIKSHARAKNSEAGAVFRTLEKKLKRVDPQGEWQNLPSFIEGKTEFAKKGGHALGFMGKLKGAFGFEEGMKLTSEELQTIIQEEIENITKGN